MMMDTKDRVIQELKDRTNLIYDEKKRKIISSIINHADWYKVVTLDTFISILNDLNYNVDEAKNIYVLLNTYS